MAFLFVYCVCLKWNHTVWMTVMLCHIGHYGILLGNMVQYGTYIDVMMFKYGHVDTVFYLVLYTFLICFDSILALAHR